MDAVAVAVFVDAAGVNLAATIGGRHRDDGTVFPNWSPADRELST